MYKPSYRHSKHTRDPENPPKKSPLPTVCMADHKNSHKGGCTGSRIGSEADEGITEKNKMRLKYMTSIPLQEYKAMMRSTNLELQKTGNGNNPRARSQAPSEALDLLSEPEISPIRTRTQPEKAILPPGGQHERPEPTQEKGNGGRGWSRH